MRSFIQRHLDPDARLGEVLFGLIMALGFTGSVRLGLEEPDNRELFLGILGCNVAWAIVDGVMYLLTELFERGRVHRLAREIRAARSDEEALELVQREVASRLPIADGIEGGRDFYALLLGLVRRSDTGTTRVERGDVHAAVAVAVLIVVSTLPIVVPFLLFEDPAVAVRISNGIALTMLFLLGAWWGRIVGANPWRIGLGLTGIGIALVLVTIALGG